MAMVGIIRNSDGEVVATGSVTQSANGYRVSVPASAKLPSGRMTVEIAPDGTPSGPAAVVVEQAYEAGDLISSRDFKLV